MNERSTLKINAKSHLEIGGMDCVDIAEKFGTPLYVYDEAHIRNMMGVYRDTLNREYDGNGLVLYASKAFACKAIYKIAKQERIGIDVVSGGELYTAIKAGFPTDKICMHGNNKLLEELKLAVDNRVGLIAVDSFAEADLLNALAEERGITQKVLIRVNPGIEAHTHAYIQTTRTDSKFGFSVLDGTAEEISAYVKLKKNLQLVGYHCHIGSQIFEAQSFVLAARALMDFMALIKKKLSLETEVLNLGGGFGIWYSNDDPKLKLDDYSNYLKILIKSVKEKAKILKLKEPYLMIEPGRSIIGEAGITLYRVGNVKDIKGIRKYLAVDGGMFENPRYALYQAKYSALIANRAKDECVEKVSIAGKCCESGDLIAVDVPLPSAKPGDILAVLSTGAYHYSMASNYNRNLIPAAIFVTEGKAEYVIKPQNYEDLIRNDVVPEYLNE